MLFVRNHLPKTSISDVPHAATRPHCAAYAVMLVAALAAGSVSQATEDRERSFAHGLELFDAAKTPDDYRQAAAVFGSVLEDGFQSGAVYYNMGNAFMKAGDFGRAIAAYRKAKEFWPRDPYVDANLRQALVLAPGRLQEPPPPWWKNVIFWSGYFSYGEKCKIALALALAAFSLGFCGLLWKSKAANRAAATAILLAVCMGIDAGISYAGTAGSNHGVIVAETVARKGNSATWQPAFDKPLKDGAEFTIMERRGDWIFGHFEGVGDGWVPLNAVAE